MSPLNKCPVLLVFENQKLQQMVSEMCELAGVPFAQPEGSSELLGGVEPVPPGSLVFVEPATRDAVTPTEQITRVVCSFESVSVGGLQLPRDLAPLIELVREWKAGAKQDLPVVLVGSWHGGSGSTASALELCRALEGVMLDASGNTNSLASGEGDFLTWSGIQADDVGTGASIVSSLPRVKGVPVLTANEEAPVTPADFRVSVVALKSPRPVVVDCGSNVSGLIDLWDRLALGGADTQVLLLGRASDQFCNAAARTLALCAADVSNTRVIALRRGRQSSLFRIVTDSFDVRWMRMPRLANSRGWRRVAELI